MQKCKIDRLCINETGGIYFAWDISRVELYAQKINFNGNLIDNTKRYLFCASEAKYEKK